MTLGDLCFTSATDIATMVREKAISPVEVTEAFFARIAKLNPLLSVYVTVTPDLVRKAANIAAATCSC